MLGPTPGDVVMISAVVLDTVASTPAGYVMVPPVGDAAVDVTVIGFVLPGGPKL